MSWWGVFWKVLIILIIIGLPLLIYGIYIGSQYGINWGVFSKLGLFFVLFVGSGFLIFGGLMIAPLHPKGGRYLAYIGVVGIMVLLLIIETSLIDLRINTYLEGKLWTDCQQTPKNVISFVSCAITGYQPAPQGATDIWGMMGVYGFYIFGLVAPLVILTALFTDFVKASGVIQSTTNERIIGLGLGFMAYRGFVVSRLIYILDIGSAGIALIALNFIWLGGILGYINRSFKQWQTLEAEMELSIDMPNVARNLKRIADEWKGSKQVAGDFADPIFLRNLTLIVGTVEAQKLLDESRKVTKDTLGDFKNRFKNAIDDKMK